MFPFICGRVLKKKNDHSPVIILPIIRHLLGDELNNVLEKSGSLLPL